MPKLRGQFTCTDCRQSFETGKEFSDHFKRGTGGIEIVGCVTAAQLRVLPPGKKMASIIGPADRGVVRL